MEKVSYNYNWKPANVAAEKTNFYLEMLFWHGIFNNIKVIKIYNEDSRIYFQNYNEKYSESEIICKKKFSQKLI